MPLIEAAARRLQRCVLLATASLWSAHARSPPIALPIEERSATPRATVVAASAGDEPGQRRERRGQADRRRQPTAASPAIYTIKPGDTLIRIGLDNGQNWKDLMRWNNLTNPNLIEPGQVIRIVAPGVDPATATTRPVTTARVETRPLDSRPRRERPPGTASAAASQAAPRGSARAAAAAAAAAPAREADDDVAWGWPATASVSTPFDDARNKGLVFRGKAGDPVFAAADGRVVYAGSGLRGYGNLIILKHNPTYLTAYAHNQTLLVKDDQNVKRGQKIAEMGSTDADSVQLHFEIRRQGKPIDPARLLPPR